MSWKKLLNFSVPQFLSRKRKNNIPLLYGNLCECKYCQSLSIRSLTCKNCFKESYMKRFLSLDKNLLCIRLISTWKVTFLILFQFQCSDSIQIWLWVDGVFFYHSGKLRYELWIVTVCRYHWWHKGLVYGRLKNNSNTFKFKMGWVIWVCDLSQNK